MEIMLEERILDIVETLKKAGKLRLAECIEKNWTKTALAYSTELNSWKPERPMEKELVSAFAKELDRLEVREDLKAQILESLQKRRVLQTAPHLAITESPRMLCINWLGSLGVPEKEFYVVGMFSGIPFSNRSRPGRINKKDNNDNLFPSSMQDALVYRSLIPEKLVEVVQGLPKDMHGLRALFPGAHIGASYTKWALNGCRNIEKRIFGKENIIFIDINEVVTEYLLQVLHNRDHIMHQIFFDVEVQREFMQAFPDEIMFYSPVVDGKFESMENMVLTGGMLKSKNKEIYLIDPRAQESLITELRERRLCPALITGFLTLAFLNEFKCFGSFAQVEYLPVYQEKLSKLKFMQGLNFEKVPTANLTTGVFPAIPDLYPVDIILGTPFKPNQNMLFGELLVSMKDVLLESYFTGDVRKK